MSTSTPHLYPLALALRTQKLIQGSVFYGAFVDLAAGEYVKVVSDPEGNIKRLLLNAGLSEENYEISWDCFVEYMNEFQHPIFQHSLYSMISHWDWYVSNLGKFVSYAIKHISPEKPENPYLVKLNRKPFREQISILNMTTEISFRFEDAAVESVEEMSLVRNLGMHNEWDVDEDYLKKTNVKNWQVGQKRTFDIIEVNKWHSALLNIVSVTANSLANHYANVPKYI